MRKSLAFVSILMLLSCGAQAAHTPAPAAQAAFDRAVALDKEKKSAEAMAAYVQAIEADPEFLEAHDGLAEARDHWKMATYEEHEKDEAAFERLLNERNDSIEAKYREWERRFPDSLGIAYGMGLQLYNREDPRAKPYLLKVVARDAKFARVWAMLSNDADRWGDKSGAMEYMRKASQAEPDNAEYAFYSASGWSESDPLKWEAASLEVARRFPTSERGAQALYWLGQRSVGEAKRIGFWEQARTAFPPTKFNWTRSSMASLFDAYLRTTPEKAIVLARDMAAAFKDEEAKAWSERVDFAKVFLAARTLADIGSYTEALALIEKLPVGRRTANPELTQMLKAEVLAGAGKVQAAYDSIAQRFAAEPKDELRAALVRYGNQLGKTEAQVDAEVWVLRTAAAKPAPASDLDLGLYTSDKSLSLASLKGKVVFVTFWFPGCGPCRAEFPHFENVVTKFKGNQELVYLGINVLHQQDAYVLPFMESTKYSFTPLKGGGIDKAYGVNYCPYNFLIDREGRIIFSNFNTNTPQAEVVLQRMIEALLARPAGA